MPKKDRRPALQQWLDAVPGLDVMKRVAYQDYDVESIYPPEGYVFRALELVAPPDVRVVLLGQSLNWLITPDSAMLNIEKELGGSINDPTLESWANQGVLMLNPVLTQEIGKPKSHCRMGWQDEVADAVRVALNVPATRPALIVMGNESRELLDKDLEGDYIFHVSHPHAMSANRGSRPFIGSGVFTNVNNYLKAQGKKPIKWR